MRCCGYKYSEYLDNMLQFVGLQCSGYSEYSTSSVSGTCIIADTAFFVIRALYC